MSVISKERVETKQADNMAVVRELIRREGAPAIGLGNYSAELDRLRQAFAGLTKDILFMAADGDTVMTRFRMTGTLADHQNDERDTRDVYRNVAVTASGLMVHRVVGGRVVEAWIDYDRAGVTGTGQVGRGVPVYKRGNGNAPTGTDLEPAATGGEQRLSSGDH
jgi:predicted ester cyclase